VRCDGAGPVPEIEIPSIGRPPADHAANKFARMIELVDRKIQVYIRP
jgi:hypothetical protein